jgi:hypothetical protein
MPSREQGEYQSEGSQLLHPSPLPPELAEVLRGQRFACLTHPTDRGTVFVINAPGEEIEWVRGQVPMGFRTELYAHPAAPVPRMVLTLYDQPDSHLALETFVNVADPAQRADFEALDRQRELTLLFYDEALKHRLTKLVRVLGGVRAAAVLERADAMLKRISPARFDFDRAKAELLRTVSL